MAACWCAPAIPRRRSTSPGSPGLNPAGVICEIMNDDGTMARLPDLVAFAQRHGLKVAKIADLISYRLSYDKLVERDIASTLHTRFAGDFRLQVYTNVLTGVEHIALVKGDLEVRGRCSCGCTRSMSWRTFSARTTMAGPASCRRP